MDRLEPDERAPGEFAVSEVLAHFFEDWVAEGRPAGAAVRVSGDADLDGEYEALARSRRITIVFPAFTDGRGFSHARRLRAAGFEGELIADGEVLADQWVLLERCGFSRLASQDTAKTAARLAVFSDSYQAHSLQPEPLFRRRHG
ncbi:MAG: DUF934 domain-containing protein [Wenzhouxiangella sp.]|jgi:uncharacterized protein (DUF934 family)|nr:DUF934 domain-containing protein [Wenzhouxiangella sp.]